MLATWQNIPWEEKNLEIYTDKLVWKFSTDASHLLGNLFLLKYISLNFPAVVLLP